MANDFKSRLAAAEKILSVSSTSLDKLESVADLVKGINPKLDKALSQCTQALSTIEDIKKGDIIELVAENTPAKTDKDKRRQKKLLLFIRYFKTLKSEVKRVKAELELQNQTQHPSPSSLGKIFALAKGPAGIITVIAVATVALTTLSQKNSSPQTTSTEPEFTPRTSEKPQVYPEDAVRRATIQVLLIADKQVPLSEVHTATGSECLTSGQPAAHYHANNPQFATALDGTQIPDPGTCGLGKVDQIKIDTISLE